MENLLIIIGSIVVLRILIYFFHKKSLDDTRTVIIKPIIRKKAKFKHNNYWPTLISKKDINGKHRNIHIQAATGYIDTSENHFF